MLILQNNSVKHSFINFSIWVFYHEHSRFTGQQGKEEAITLTPLYHFHLIHLEISREITAESSPLHLASSRNQAGKPLISERKSLNFLETFNVDNRD